MTERLYYNDPTILEFDASIVTCQSSEGIFKTVLDRSAFYPTSGGQSHDSGSLNDIEIIEVVEDEAGEVVHLSKQPIGEEGQSVTGRIDGVRRRDNREKHTAQHILSQAFIKLFDFETVSVHLGASYASVELDVAQIDSEQLMQAEELSNQIIAENHRVAIRFIDPDEARKLPLRKIPDRKGKIRVIQVGDFDYSACGGTHCLSTAEVGLLKIIGHEKMRGHCSVKFLAGRLAREDYLSRFAITDHLSNELTCHLEDIEDRFAKTFDENTDLRKEIRRLQAELEPVWVKQLATNVITDLPVPIVVEAIPDLDSKLLSKLATAVAAEINGLAMLLSQDRAAIACAQDMDCSAGQLARHFVESFGIKGGGNDRQAQLAGVDVSKIDVYRKSVSDYVAR